MLRAQFYSDRKILLERAPMLIPAAGELVVKVASCCICGSDLRTYLHGNARVQAGAILGHELSGTISAVGESVTGWQLGDRVAVGADIPCAECEWCLSGQPNACATNLAIGYQMDGGFAEYIRLDRRVVSAGPLVKVPPSVSLDMACLAEPLACCINGFEKMLPLYLEIARARLSTVIFGAGPVGCLLAFLSRVLGIGRTVVLDTNQERLEWLQATENIFPVWLDSRGEWKQKVDALTSHPRLIFTACSSVEAQRAALSALGPQSALNFFGGVPAGTDMVSILTNEIHYKQATLTGSHGSTPKQFRKAMQILESGKIPAEKLITHRYPLADIQTAFENALSRQGLKTLIQSEV